MTRAIGEIFKDGDVTLRVELNKENNSSCEGCYYFNPVRAQCINKKNVSGECTTSDIRGIRTFILFTKYDPPTIKLDLTE